MPTPSTPAAHRAPNSQPDKTAVIDALLDELLSDSDETKNVPVWQSFVFHKGQCFYVSTIERTYETCAGRTRGCETIVWAYNQQKAERGKMLHQAGGVHDHQQICRCLIAEGLFPDEDDERTKRFCLKS